MLQHTNRAENGTYWMQQIKTTDTVTIKQTYDGCSINKFTKWHHTNNS